MSCNEPIIWLTGLSGSGKSTIADAVADALREQNIPVYRLDGDVLRSGLCSDLGFSTEDREENLRRAGEVANILADAGHVVVASFITPTEASRQRIQERIGSDRFVLVHVDCPLAVCEERDVKGLYKQARGGTIKEFTGVSHPYEAPISPALMLKTHEQDLATCTAALIDVILQKRSSHAD